jgi:lipoprotein NlpI
MGIVFQILLAFSQGAPADEAPAELLRRAKAAQDKPEEALRLASKAIARDPRSVPAYLFRGKVYSSLGRNAAALADFAKVIDLDPKAAEAYNLRGAEHFKLGHIAASIADFDKFLELRPQEKPGHWMRGISYYYAGKFAEGRQQFAAYEQVDTNDVENAVWHYLCNARLVGADKARAEMLKIGRDARVPMMQVYDLFRGRARPEDVLKTAREAKAQQQKQALFLAHLYLGLYYDTVGDPQRAREHMTQAASGAVAGGYMGNVAQVHLMQQRK